MKNIEKKNIIREIIKIASPMAFQMLLVSSLQLVDNLFIGHLESAKSVAAGVNAINNISFIISTLVSGFIIGIGIYLIQAGSTKNIAAQHEFFRLKVIWLFILSSIIISITFIFLTQIAKLWISSDNTEDSAKSLTFAKDYGDIVIPSMFLDFVILIYANTYKEMKKVKVPVVIAILALVINSILNYILMYVLHFGVKGAAWATLTARLFELVVWVIYVQITKPEFIPKLRTFFSVRISRIFMVFPKSCFWTINNFFLSLAFTIQIMIIARISTDAGASLNSAGVFLQLMYAFTGGFSQAIGIMIVSYIALGNTDSIKRYVKQLAFISGIFGAICGLIISLLSPLMIILYNYSRATNINSVIMIVAVGIVVPINLISMVYTSTLKGAGFSKILIFIDAAFSWVVSLPLCLLLVELNTNLNYGWIYAIVSLTAIFKPIPIIIFFKKKTHEIRPLEWEDNILHNKK